MVVEERVGELKCVANVKGIGKIFKVFALFDEALELFTRNGLELPTARDTAYIHIKKGTDDYASWIREGTLCLPKGYNKMLFVRESLVLKNPTEAVQSMPHYMPGLEFFLDEQEVASYLEAAKKEDVLVITSNEAVPTNRFGEDEKTRWLFRDQAIEYGLFLRDLEGNSRVEELIFLLDQPQYIVMQRAPYANQLCMLGAQFIKVGNIGIGLPHWVTGVLRETAGGGAENLPDHTTIESTVS